MEVGSGCVLFVLLLMWFITICESQCGGGLSISQFSVQVSPELRSQCERVNQ